MAFNDVLPGEIKLPFSSKYHRQKGRGSIELTTHDLQTLIDLLRTPGINSKRKTIEALEKLKKHTMGEN